MEKKCLQCNNIFQKPSTNSIGYWTGRKYCSRECYWQDGFTIDHKKKLSIAHKGKASIFRGIKRPQFSGEKHPLWKGGEVNLKCKFCKKEFSVRRYRINDAKYCSIKCKTDDNLGLTKMNERIRKSKIYKDWRNIIFKRDDHTCVLCGSRGGILNVDHIKPFAKYPELRLSIDNGRTLCDKCHKGTETYGFKTWRSNLAFLNNI